MKPNDLVTAGDGPSDPWTAERFAPQDELRRAWLDEACKRELALTRAARLASQKGGRKAGRKNGGDKRSAQPLETRVTHKLRPVVAGGLLRTYCGHPVGKPVPTISRPAIPRELLSAEPTCTTCLRGAHLPAGELPPDEAESAA